MAGAIVYGDLTTDVLAFVLYGSLVMEEER